MRAVGLVAVLDAQVAPSALQDGNAFGHGPQVGEVVGAQAADVGRRWTQRGLLKPERAGRLAAACERKQFSEATLRLPRWPRATQVSPGPPVTTVEDQGRAGGRLKTAAGSTGRSVGRSEVAGVSACQAWTLSEDGGEVVFCRQFFG